MKSIITKIRSVFVKTEAEKQIENSIRELRNYTDAELNDIGLSRLCIEECVRGEAANGYQRAS